MGTESENGGCTCGSNWSSNPFVWKRHEKSSETWREGFNECCCC
uniref:Metallothionein type 2a n=1 Tax=Elaeis guineensis var. tenera TaxID=51953 RepID=D1LUI3_ELAGV|nr:metallothionein type 2a [Elaeis guineensis]